MTFKQGYSFLVFVILASLDNAAAGVLPPLYAIIARDFAADEAQLGLVTAVYIIILAASAAVLGYQGDRGQRKGWLLGGTVVWGTAMVLSGQANSLGAFFFWQAITAVGVGGVSAIGFSVVSDIIPAHRRGFALSLWSMSQLLGAAFGALLASTVGATNWRWPFFILAAIGFLFALLYFFTKPPQRGQAEPELTAVFAANKRYEHRITLADLPHIWARRSNRWLLSQRLFLSLALGSTIWIPRWAIARVEAEGFALETATIVGNFFIILFNVGSLLAVLAGHLGDRWQQKNPFGRVNLALIGLLGSIPFFIILFFLPLRDIAISDNDSIAQLALTILLSVFTNPYVALAFVVAFIAVTLFSAEPPNWAALITDVNLPEHRGTIIGLSRLFSAVGNASSVSLTGFLITYLTAQFTPPLNYAVGLALFQLLVLPAGLCYFGVRKYVVMDKTAVRTLLTQRAKAATDPNP
ncbi:MAG: MFS transporter [Chloroflexota bacterium]